MTDRRVAPVRWGILGAANIALKKVIPGMQASALARVVAIASRDIAKARAAADHLDIPRAYGSYQELIDDPDIEAIYNPLPNHLHVPWSIRAAEQGKHVLCEKPSALTAQVVTCTDIPHDPAEGDPLEFDELAGGRALELMRGRASESADE